MNHAIVVAGGRGKRMGEKENKVFLELNGKPIIYHTIKKFQDCKSIDEIIIVTRKEYIKKIEELKKNYKFNKIKSIVEGGKERQDSVYNGLMSIKGAEEDDIIIVHNGCNPLVKDSEITSCISAAKKYGAAIAGFPLKDTIKKIKNGFVESTISRENIFQIQTPQCIKYGLFLKAFENLKRKNLKVTDDSSMIESLGKKVKIVPCSYENIKITTKEDLRIAEGIMKIKNSGEFRTGMGQDSHRFSKDKNKKLVLGGFTIDEIGFDANSDGDVIIHALFNAVSSAIGERSLGFYADQMCKKGITDSKEYLKVILEKMKILKFELNNISIAIEASKPRLEKHTDCIKGSLSRILGLDKEKIGISYTSGESLTDFGKGLGIQCFVYVSLFGLKKPDLP